MKRRNELWKFMHDHNLSDHQVAKMLSVSIMTVKIWKCNSERVITDKDFQLLKYMVNAND